MLSKPPPASCREDATILRKNHAGWRLCVVAWVVELDLVDLYTTYTHVERRIKTSILSGPPTDPVSVPCLPYPDVPFFFFPFYILSMLSFHLLTGYNDMA